jgi:hypothetical protein
MDLDDYGIIDTLTPSLVAAIDRGLNSEVTSSHARRVARMLVNFMENCSAAVPGVPDYSYIGRIEHMIESGVLVVCGGAESLIQCDVRLA